MPEYEPATRSQKLKLAALVCEALRNYRQPAHQEFSVRENDGQIEMTLTVRPVGSEPAPKKEEARAAPSPALTQAAQTPVPVPTTFGDSDQEWRTLAMLIQRMAQRLFHKYAIGLEIRLQGGEFNAVLPVPMIHDPEFVAREEAHLAETISRVAGRTKGR